MLHQYLCKYMKYLPFLTWLWQIHVPTLITRTHANVRRNHSFVCKKRNEMRSAVGDTWDSQWNGRGAAPARLGRGTPCPGSKTNRSHQHEHRAKAVHAEMRSTFTLSFLDWSRKQAENDTGKWHDKNLKWHARIRSKNKKHGACHKHSKRLPSSICIHVFIYIYICICTYCVCECMCVCVCLPFVLCFPSLGPESKAKNSVEVGPAYHNRTEHVLDVQRVARRLRDAAERSPAIAVPPGNTLSPSTSCLRSLW